MARWRGRTPLRTVARVNLYVVPRTRAFLSEEEIDAVIECGLALIDTMSDELRFIRSYVVHEDDGTYSAFCVYEATGPSARTSTPRR